jgi:hypothetical protein
MSLVGKPFRRAIEAVKEKRLKQSARTLVQIIAGRIAVSALSFLTRIKLLENRSFRRGEFGFFLKETYYSTNNAGFFSCVGSTLADLSRDEGGMCKTVKANFAMSLYKRGVFRDVWPVYFSQVPETMWKNSDHQGSQVLPSNLEVHRWWNLDYSMVPVELATPWVQKWFCPSKRVLDLVDSLKAELGLQYPYVIGVHFRGTDKVTELETPPADSFVREARAALTKLPDSKILVVTDQTDAQVTLTTAFQGRVRIVPGLATSSGEIGTHHLDHKDPQGQGALFFASVLLLSQASHLITHTGNGALWEVLFRGTAAGTKQL